MEQNTNSKSETVVVWKENFAFDGRVEGFNVPMDAKPPLGHHYGPSPKELVLVGLAGCSGMDIVGLLKKDKQFIDRFEIFTHGVVEKGTHPAIFTSIQLIFSLEGAIEARSAIKAVELSHSVYCSVAAMLYRSVPITWILFLNGEKIHEGRTNFERNPELYQSRYEG